MLACSSETGKSPYGNLSRRGRADYGRLRESTTSRAPAKTVASEPLLHSTLSPRHNHGPNNPTCARPVHFPPLPSISWHHSGLKEAPIGTIPLTEGPASLPQPVRPAPAHHRQVLVSRCAHIDRARLCRTSPALLLLPTYYTLYTIQADSPPGPPPWAHGTDKYDMKECATAPPAIMVRTN